MLGQNTDLFGVKDCTNWAEKTYCKVFNEIEELNVEILKVSIIHSFTYALTLQIVLNTFLYF